MRGEVKKTSNLAVTVQPEYRLFVEELKSRVIAARISAARAVNTDLVFLYRDLGCGIAKNSSFTAGANRWCRAWRPI